MSSTASKILNFLLYQTGWFCCVLGAAWGFPMAGALMALLLVLLHLALVKAHRSEALLMLFACGIGVSIDSAQQALGLIIFTGAPVWPLGLPLWVFVIWAQFATLLRFALWWLRGRYLLGAILGFLGGPAAYWGGVRLGAAEFVTDLPSGLISLGLVWAGIIPLLLWMSQRIDDREGRYRCPFPGNAPDDAKVP